jgi:hypothetical protein
MEGLVIDIIGVLLALGLGLGGGSYGWYLWNKKRSKDRDVREAKMKAKGKDNLEEVELESRRKCHFCKKLTSPDKDVFLSGLWYHKECWKGPEK